MRPDRAKKIDQVVSKRQLDLAVILENVHDPHNIAAVLRTCDAVGIVAVYVLYSDPGQEPRKIVLGKRTSKGTRKWVDVFIYRDVDTCFTEVRSRYKRILAASLAEGSRSIYEAEFDQPTAILFGNEHNGVSPEALSKSDGSIFIPQHGMAQSLNISVACAVVLYECLRQRTEKGMYDQDPGTPREDLEALRDEYYRRHETYYKGRLPRKP